MGIIPRLVIRGSIQHSFDDMQCISYLEEYLGKMGIGVGLPAGGTLMFGWEKTEEAMLCCDTQSLC